MIKILIFQTHEEILAEDSRKAMRKLEHADHDDGNRIIPLGKCIHNTIRANLLSPKLRQRFMGVSPR